MKKICSLVFIFATTCLGQYYPPTAIAGQNPSGQLVNVVVDSSANLFTNGSGSAALATVIQGYLEPVAMTGQSPSGQQVYLKTDVNGNLYVNCQTGCTGGGGGATLPFPGIVFATSGSAGTVATSAQIQTAIGAGVYGAVSGTLGQFASTTSAQLAAVLSDESGTGVAVFSTNATLVTPALGTPSAINLANATFPASIVTLTGTQTLTNKTFTSPILGAASGTSLNLTGGLTIGAGNGLTLSGDGILFGTGTSGDFILTNTAASGMDGLMLGSNTSSAPCLQPSGTTVKFVVGGSTTCGSTAVGINIASITGMTTALTAAQGGTGLTGGSETVASSATPTFSVNVRVSRNVLTASVTSFTLASGIYDGQEHCLDFTQGSGNYTVAGPSNVVGLFSVGLTNALDNVQCFLYNTTAAKWKAESPGVINE